MGFSGHKRTSTPKKQKEVFSDPTGNLQCCLLQQIPQTHLHLWHMSHGKRFKIMWEAVQTKYYHPSEVFVYLGPGSLTTLCHKPDLNPPDQKEAFSDPTGSFAMLFASTIPQIPQTHLHR